MFERTIVLARTDDPGLEEPTATRDRVKALFPPGSVRRMTQLGLLMGSVLHEVQELADTAVIYASEFGESRALESYLESFPNASPTLFQTSIHPSGVQQGLISRQRPISEFIPIAGGPTLIGQALLASMLATSPRVVLCGGEERGTWLVSHRAASERTFAFLLLLSADPSLRGAGRLRLRPTEVSGDYLQPAAWFDLLHRRESFSHLVAPGWQAELEWS